MTRKVDAQGVVVYLVVAVLSAMIAFIVTVRWDHADMLKSVATQQETRRVLDTLEGKP